MVQLLGIVLAVFKIVELSLAFLVTIPDAILRRVTSSVRSLWWLLTELGDFVQQARDYHL